MISRFRELRGELNWWVGGHETSLLCDGRGERAESFLEHHCLIHQLS